jgi:hypothetical protein
MAAGAAALAETWALAQPPIAQEILRPEDFGARGDGVTNDTNAFAALAEHVNRRGGGTVVLRRTTYIVGRQFPPLGAAQGWAFNPGRIMEFRNLSRPLVIQGNGARLKCAPGLRYGTFDRATGRPVLRALPNFRQDELATPYRSMIDVTGCRAPIEISNIELDGNLAQLQLGGPYGDTGHQIPAIGLWLADNLASETITNLYSHHHGQDGIEIFGDDKRTARSRFEGIVSDSNGRQGLSLIGGRGYDFERCKFSRSGRSVVTSAPGAGVDLEAEGGKIIRDLTFTDCEFVDNAGCGLLADSGDIEGVTFTRCKFVGTTSWAAWPKKPRFLFRASTFVGAVVHPFASKNPRLATRFEGCRFTDDPNLSPTKRVYLGSGPIVNMAVSDNVFFSKCVFNLVKEGVLPWGWRATYSDCTLSQVSKAVAYPKGRYLGRNTIRGHVDLYNSLILGSLTVNGSPVAKGLMGGDPW